MATITTGSSFAWRRCANRPSIMKQCVERLLGKERKGPGLGDDEQDRAADAPANEAFDGEPDPSFQALHRRLQGPRRARFMPPSRRRKESSASISCRTAPTGPIAARSGRRASLICRPWISCAAAICWPMSRPFSARSISSSARWTGEYVVASLSWPGFAWPSTPF